jgi:hypothetical protein
VVFVLALIGLGATFLLFVLPFVWMPDVANTGWHELSRGVAPGYGAHEPDHPYFILGTNETLPSAIDALKRRVMSQGWRVYQDPNPFGGVTLERTDDPGRNLFLEPFPANPVRFRDLEDHSVGRDRVQLWQQQYAHIYLLEMFFA